MSLNLEQMFRELRAAWFDLAISDLAASESEYKKMKDSFDLQTELLIKGHDRAIAPKDDRELGHG